MFSSRSEQVLANDDYLHCGQSASAGGVAKRCPRRRHSISEAAKASRLIADADPLTGAAAGCESRMWPMLCQVPSYTLNVCAYECVCVCWCVSLGEVLRLLQTTAKLQMELQSAFFLLIFYFDSDVVLPLPNFSYFFAVFAWSHFGWSIGRWVVINAAAMDINLAA